MKLCPGCRESREELEFGPRRGVPGARSRCRGCEAKYRREYRLQHLEKCRSIGRITEARRRVDPETRMTVLEAQRRCYREGGKERAQHYLKLLKVNDFFRWKARKSYIWLSADELRELWERQGGRCALTDRPLDSSAELDHVVPKSRGGEDALGNARWLCRDANQAKHSLLDGEFLALCAEVTVYAEWIGREVLSLLGIDSHPQPNLHSPPA